MYTKIEQRYENTAKSKTFNNILDGFNLRHKSVLDIGCSYGEHLIHFGVGSTGITISEEEASYGQGRNLDTRYGNIESATFSIEKTYQSIYANNLFEHLYAPHKFLSDIKKYLAPEGLLILGVPCIPKITFLLQIQKFNGSMASGHINFFTKETLQYTVERAGWHIKMIRGFHFVNPFIDNVFSPVYPHLYVIAEINKNFSYSAKRQKEIAGYESGLLGH